MRNNSKGMSSLDTIVILGICGLSLLVYLYPEHIWKLLLSAVVLIIVFIIGSSLRDGAANDARLRDLYLKGEIEEERYIAQVGEKYFQKHHGGDKDASE